MTQAQAAAESGDFALAEKLRQEAQSKEHVRNSFGVPTSGLFYLGPGDQDLAAKAQLSGPMARTVGGLVKQGREFLDPRSETSQRFKESLTQGPIEQVDLGERRAERTIAGEQRQFQRTSRDIGLSRGAARNFMAERSILARAGERFATARADVHEQAAAERAQIFGDAARTFETFSRQFAADTAKFGQAFLQNQGGIREQFQGAVDQLQLAGVKLADAFAARHEDLYKAEAARGQAKQAARRELFTKIATVGLGLATGGIGALATGAGLASLTTLGGALSGAATAAGLGGVGTGGESDHTEERY